MMELHQIRYALAVAQARSFTRAAQTLHVSQSGVSAQVALLERELGVVLFQRTSRGIRITPAGRSVLERLRSAATAVDDVRSVADELNGLVRGAVTVGAVAGLGWPPFLDALQEVHDTHPGLDLSLREGISGVLQDEVADGALDLAVVSWTRQPRAELATWIALEERVTAFVASDHPLAHRARVRPVELLDHPVICLTPGTGMRAAHDAMMAAENLAAPVTWEVTLPATARALAHRRMGVAVLTSSLADPPSDLVPLTIASRHTRSLLGVVWREGVRPSAATQAALSALRRHLGAGPVSGAPD